MWKRSLQKKQSRSWRRCYSVDFTLCNQHIRYNDKLSKTKESNLSQCSKRTLALCHSQFVEWRETLRWGTLERALIHIFLQKGIHCPEALNNSNKLSTGLYRRLRETGKFSVILQFAHIQIINTCELLQIVTHSTFSHPYVLACSLEGLCRFYKQMKTYSSNHLSSIYLLVVSSSLGYL